MPLHLDLGADEETLGYVEDLLIRNDLPAEDVRENPGAFYVARTGDERVGAGGIEQYGADGLLRSVVVEEHARGEGVGTELCVALEATAREGGVERLFLLTTTAAGFFAGRGYTVGHKQADTRCFVWRSTRRLDGETPTSVFTYLCPTVYAEIEREAAPERVRNTAEFAALCPASATCLQKSL